MDLRKRRLRMSMDILEYKTPSDLKPNNIYCAEKIDISEFEQLNENLKIVRIDCKNCQDTKSLWKEFSNKEILPFHFKNNWDAFFDSIEYFDFWNDYDRVILVMDNEEFFMKKELVWGLIIYKSIKENMAYKLIVPENTPPVNYIFNINNSTPDSFVRYVKKLYYETELVWENER